MYVASVLMAAGLAIGFFWHLSRWPFICDDAYISFRYAANLSRHGALVYNLDPIEHVEGYTNFAWVLGLAVFDRVGLAPERVAPVLCAAASLCTLVLAVDLLRSLRRRFGRRPHATGWPESVASPGEVLPVALLVCVPEFVVWGSGGLETSTACALVLGAMVAWMRDRPVLAAALAAAAGLTRPDALLPIAAFGIGWLIPVVVDERTDHATVRWSAIPWRRLGVALLVFVLPLLAQFMFRRAYYGAWWPNTWAIKHHGQLLRDTNGVAYLQAWSHALHLVWLAPFAALLRLRHLTLALPIAVLASYAWWVGGDFMAYSRFLLPATTLLAVLLVWLALDADLALEDRLSRRLPVLALVVGGLALALATQVPARVETDRAKAWIDGRWEGVMGMDRFARERVVAGRWMREHLPSDTLVSVGAAGAMPYAAGVQIIDAYGLVDPELAEQVTPRSDERARPGHQIVAPLSYIKARDPDLLCHVGYVGEGEPPARSARRRGRGAYRWACIPVGTIDDPFSPGGQRGVGNYCCLQPLDRTEWP